MTAIEDQNLNCALRSQEGQSLLRALRGRVVEFRAPIDELECEFEAGMIGRFKSFKLDREDEIAELIFDVGEFEDHNRGIAKADYFDKNGTPTLTVFETPYYKPINSVMLNLSDLIGKYIAVHTHEADVLMQEWRESDAFPQTTYIAWLEKQLLNQRNNAPATEKAC